MWWSVRFLVCVYVSLPVIVVWDNGGRKEGRNERNGREGMKEGVKEWMKEGKE